MRTWIGNMMDLIGKTEVIAITTNGYVKMSGEAVMGRGIARQIADKLPVIPTKLGAMIRTFGNRCFEIGSFEGTKLISFPVKPVSKQISSIDDVVSHMRDKFKKGDFVPGWACKADLGIINKSAQELKLIADKNGFSEIYLPLPGCGAGELLWSEVQSHIKDLTDDERFIFCSFKREDLE